MPLSVITALRQCRQALIAFCICLAVPLLSSCAASGHRQASEYPSDLPRRFELAATPFFPDDSHFCGPAALATSLTAAGLPTSPDALIDQVFLPGRQGSLQIEMLSGTRRQGALATIIPGSLEALFREIANGHPVVILQNLGLSWAPSWHYAVAIGYDIEADIILLRSGPMKRQELKLNTFLHTWNRSQRWAFVALRPGQLPMTATETDVVNASLAFERIAPPGSAAEAYRAGLQRWPNNATLAMGLGNTLYASGDQRNAEVIFRRVIDTHQLAAAYNNLANLLLARGEIPQARALAEQGLVVSGPLRATLLETLTTIETQDKGQ